MELLLQRKPATDDALLGDWFVQGHRTSFSLERASRAIPAGRYLVRLTVSARATSGELWSPWDDHRLPLIEDVPGRSGVRIHAANEYDELSGCVALGYRRAGSALQRSRAALETLMGQLEAAEQCDEENWLTVKDPLPPGVQPELNA